MSADDGPGTREVARRLFAAEYDDATLSYSESDEERAPNYVVTPTGARVNRLFVVGVLTEAESVNEDMLRARIVDHTGAFVAYAGQYQPDALAFFERSTSPAFVALTGKARTFQPEDSEQVFTSVRPETVNQVDADTRDRWTISAAKATLRRLSLFDAALSSGLRGDDLERHLRDHDVEDALAAGIPRAIDHYGTTTGYLDAVRQVALDALAVVAGEREEVRELSLAPDEGGPAALGQIPAALRAADAIATPAESVDGAASSTAADDAAPGDVGGDETPRDVADDESGAEPTAQETTDTAEGPSAETAGSAESTAATSESDVETAETTSEPDVQADAAAADSDDLGSFDESLSAGADESEEATTDESTEATTDESDTEATAGDESIPDVAEDDLYEFDEEEREAVREEHGLSFESGAEVDSPGEAEIETPDSGDATQGPQGTDDVDVEDTASAEAASDREGGGEDAVSDEESTDDEAEAVAAEGDSADGELEGELTDVVVDVMAELDEGDGADRDEVVAAVVQRRGTDPGDVEDAIQEALMDGKCYEPGEDRLKAI